jgi:hypothetical protein
MHAGTDQEAFLEMARIEK